MKHDPFTHGNELSYRYRLTSLFPWRGQQGKKISKYFTPILYIVSFLLIYKYFNTKKDSSQTDAVDSYIFNFSEENVPSISKEELSYEYYSYSASEIMLPVAPYRHVSETTDLRATQIIYLDAVRQYLKKIRLSGKNKPPQFGFHWKDWIEMSDLVPLIEEKPNCFIAGVLGSNVRTVWPGCIDPNTKDPEELNFYFENPAIQHESEFRLSLRGRSYLYTLAPIPNKLVFLTGDLAFVVKLGLKRDIKKNGLMLSFIKGKLEELNNDKIDEAEAIRQPISAQPILDEIAIELKRDLINYDGPSFDYLDVARSEFELPPKKKKTRKARNAKMANNKHFANVLIDNDGHKYEANYDWRFFKKSLDHSRHRAALHQTIRAWLEMTKNLEITTWLSQESLIGWARNGIILPWENVVHFELPAREMGKLATSFNYTLIITDPSENSNTYLVDVSPHFMERARKNDGNASPEAPDARFIDTKTGVYIELNGVMSGDGRVPDDVKEQFPEEKDRFNFVNSGMGKFYHITDLLPLKKTLFEGKLANVPANAIRIVTADYNDVVSTNEFYNYKYHEHLRLWVPKDKCSYVPQEDIEIFEQGSSTYIGACHDNKIWKEYNMTQEATRYRYKEVATRYQMKLGRKDELPALYPDIWLEDRIATLKENYGYT